MKNGKLFRMLAALPMCTITSFAAAAIVSCGNTDGTELYDSDKMPDKEFVMGYETLEKSELGRGFTKDNYPKPLLIVDQAQALDKSFMESSFAALSMISQNIGIGLYHPVKTQSQSKLEETYYDAFKRGYRVFVLPSFIHGSYINEFWKKNRNELKAAGDLLFLGIDHTYSDDVDKGYGVTLNFKTYECAYVVGYAAAAYLAQKYDDPEERVISVFGGIAYRGVTDFVFGFLEGIKHWNEKNDRRVRLVSDTIDLNSGFVSTDPRAGISINKAVAGGKTKIIFPASGSAVVERALSETNKNSELYVIGADTDQSKQYVQYADRIFTSALKNMGRVVYDTLHDFYTGTTKVLTKDFFDHKENLAVEKGWRDGWVGVAKSTIKDAPLVDKLLVDGEGELIRHMNNSSSEFNKKLSVYLTIEDPIKRNDFLNAIAKDINTLATRSK